MDNFDLSQFLIEGARIFFHRADGSTHFTWRILMTHQFRFDSARDRVRAYLLDGPVSFFTALLASLQEAGKVREDINVDTAGRMLAALFFDYSFRENLNENWKTDTGEFDKLSSEIKLYSRLIGQS